MGHLRRFAILAILSFCLVMTSIVVGADGSNTSGVPASAPDGRSSITSANVQGQPNPGPNGRNAPGPANTPEAPLAIILPFVGAIAAAGMLYLVVIRRNRLPVTQ
jgi:hypothetical protein